MSNGFIYGPTSRSRVGGYTEVSIDPWSTIAAITSIFEPKERRQRRQELAAIEALARLPQEFRLPYAQALTYEPGALRRMFIPREREPELLFYPEVPMEAKIKSLRTGRVEAARKALPPPFPLEAPIGPPISQIQARAKEYESLGIEPEEARAMAMSEATRVQPEYSPEFIHKRAQKAAELLYPNDEERQTEFMERTLSKAPDIFSKKIPREAISARGKIDAWKRGNPRGKGETEYSYERRAIDNALGLTDKEKLAYEQFIEPTLSRMMSAAEALELRRRNLEESVRYHNMVNSRLLVGLEQKERLASERAKQIKDEKVRTNLLRLYTTYLHRTRTHNAEQLKLLQNGITTWPMLEEPLDFDSFITSNLDALRLLGGEAGIVTPSVGPPARVPKESPADSYMKQKGW